MQRLNDNYAVAWESMHEDGKFKGSSCASWAPQAKGDAPANVNQFGLNNQRTPAIALWRGVASSSCGHPKARAWARPWMSAPVHIYARIYDNSGTPLSDEFRINTG